MPIPKAKKIKETLEELKNYFDRLKSINAKREQAEDILEKIEEIRKLLDKKDPPVREAFGLLRRLIECVKDVAPEIPVFTQFLELYIEALKTTESFLDNVLKNFGVAAEARKRYCQIREAVEDQLEDSDLDDDDFDDEAHRRTLSALGFPFNKDGDKLPA